MAVDIGGPKGRTAVTSSRDGTWKVWDLDVRFAQNEDPKVLHSHACTLPPLEPSASAASAASHAGAAAGAPHYDRVAISPDGATVAASRGALLHFLCAETGKVLEAVPGAHDAEIAGLCWAPVALKGVHVQHQGAGPGAAAAAPALL